MSTSEEDDIEKLRKGDFKESIRQAIKRREKEIESLRKYDRGEKQIFPINLDAFDRECERIRNREYPYQQPPSNPMSTHYERMQQSAFNLMKRKKIKNFSPEELHRVFKHTQEQVLYKTIVFNAIENGLTITSLYEQDRDQGLER